MIGKAGTVQLGPLRFYSWSVIIGLVGALGAVVFRGLIAFFHNLLFLGQFSFLYNANVHTPESPWGAWVILVPALGAIGVVFLVRNFAPEAKGHGVPEVIDAMYYNKGVIRPVVALIKSLASGLSIGSGGSVGREGPIIQIGSSFGSTLAQVLRVPVWQRLTFIAAGAGAGIAATFNTPIGGVLFAVEIMLHEVSARTLVPVTIATVTASYLGRVFFGNYPSFRIPALESYDFHRTDFPILALYVGLGVLLGAVSALYIRSIYAFEDFFERRIKLNDYLRHMLGMLTVGVIMYVLFVTTGHYAIQGVGYATIQDILEGETSWFLFALFALKLLATSLTLGSGASGGVFSPALFMGATFGAGYGLCMQRLFPALTLQPAAFAVAGMAGVVGGSTGAALAAIVMIFEMTLDYTVVIPMTITVALSYGIRTLLHRRSIYTEKLARRGHDIPEALQANFFQLQRTGQLMDTHFVTVPANGTLHDFAQTASEHPGASCFLVEGPSGLLGFLTRDSALRPPTARSDLRLGDLADRKYITVGQTTPLLEVMTRLRRTGASVALVIDGDGKTTNDGVRGLITKQQIANAVIEGMELFSEEPTRNAEETFPEESKAKTSPLGQRPSGPGAPC